MEKAILFRGEVAHENRTCLGVFMRGKKAMKNTHCYIIVLNHCN